LEDPSSGIRADIVPGAGAILNAWWINGSNVVDGYRDHADFTERVHQGFRSAKLLPFVCRLHQAHYDWKGKSYTLDKFMLNGSALHGIIYDVPFMVVAEKQGPDSCSVAMQYRYKGEHPGYPFPFLVEVRYTLKESGLLEIRTMISNPAGAVSEIPIVDGWHPYFALGGKVDQWWLQFASDQMMEYDEQLIPTGNYIKRDDFVSGRLIGDLRLDNGFLLAEGEAPFCTLKNPGNGITLRFEKQLHYPILQLYIPDHRESIAIENLSGAPDAFNNGIGLTILQPGETKLFDVGISLSVTP
jgi:aldose 1-epimerase